MKIRLGTRASKLALIQAQEVATALHEHDIEIVPIVTMGDKSKESLVNIGGKGLFLKEIEESLLSGEVDIAVHSMKDVPAQMPSDLTIAAMLPRRDPRDALLSHHGKTISELKQGAKVGTCSPRRASQALNIRPDLNIVPLRGNVNSRVDKFLAGQFDAIILAMAGLERLNIDSNLYNIIPIEKMIPAVGQGVVCIQCRKDNFAMIELLSKINDQKTEALILAERGFMEGLNASCRTPIGAYAQYIDDKHIALQCFFENPDTGERHTLEVAGLTSHPYEIGTKAVHEIKK